MLILKITIKSIDKVVMPVLNRFYNLMNLDFSFNIN